MLAANTTCKCFCAMVLSSSRVSLPVSSRAIAAPYPQCPGRRLQAGPSGHVFQSNVDLRDSLGVFVPAKWTVMAMICNDLINFILTLCPAKTKSVPHQAGQWQTMATNAFSTWVRINPYNVKITTTLQLTYPKTIRFLPFSTHCSLVLPESDAKTNLPRQKLPSIAPPETILDNSSSGMPSASRSAGQAPLGTRCHAVDGIS